MRFKVAAHRILAEKVETTTHKSEFYVPETTDKKFLEGCIVDSSPEAVEAGYSSGDRIFMAKMAGLQFKYEGKEYIMLHLNEVLAKMVD